MASINYMMATIAACDASYVQQAIEHVEGFAAELRDKAGAATTRLGVLATGEQAGSLVFFQTYEELNGIDRALKVYAESSNYQALITGGNIQVRLRNIIKLEALQLESPSSDMPAYGVVTRFASSSPMTDQMQDLVPLFEESGAMLMRYGTLVTGEAAGKRLLGVAYPSMDAIEKTYDALRASDTYTSMLGEVDLEMRNIIRFVG